MINIGEQTKWMGLKPDPTNHFGFIYVIKNKLNGRLYIGKKQYWMKKVCKGCKSTVTDRQSPKWKPTCWKESDWRSYMGSSKELTRDIRDYGAENFEFRIIQQCRSRGSLYYAEIAEQVLTGCLWRVLDGTKIPLYYNKQIAACKFKPPTYDDYAEKPTSTKAFKYKG